MSVVEFACLLVISVIIFIIVMYKILSHFTPRYKLYVNKGNDKEKVYELKDINSANAKLFGIVDKNNKKVEEDLDNTRSFTPIDEKYLKKYYKSTKEILPKDEEDLPKLK